MTTIILNAESVNALFPEGTEARVELQKTVLQHLALQLIKNPAEIEALRHRLKSVNEETMKRILETMGYTHTYHGSVTVSPAAQVAMRKSLESDMNSIVNDVCKAAEERMRSEIEQRLEARIDSMASELARAALNKHLTKLVANLPGAAA